MSLKILFLTCLFIVVFWSHLTIFALPTNIETLESHDIKTLPDQFIFLTNKLKQTINRLRCPKEWKRLGGSCYYYSNSTTISNHANQTCNNIHSNHSNLIQLRNAVELLYAAHVLSKYNLTSLMIDLHPDLLKGKKLINILKNDEGRWERMKKLFPVVRTKYQRLKKEILDRLSSIGLRILRRSKKIKPIPPNQDEIEQYEYDELDSSDETDEFETMENIHGICDDIHWNVFYNHNHTENTTVYILTKYTMSDKTICSLSDVEPHTKYHYICEYVIDYCFANIVCGKHGHCVNTIQGFKCACSFLYGGLFCDKITRQGKEIIISFVIFLIFGPTLYLIAHLKKLFSVIHKKCEKSEDSSTSLLDGVEDDSNINGRCPINTLTVSSPLNSFKTKMIRNILVGSFSILILIILYSTILLKYYESFHIQPTGSIDSKYLRNITVHLATECARLTDYRLISIILGLCAIVLILIFFIIIKLNKSCTEIFNSQCEMPPPIKPFSIKNRPITSMIFGILAFEILKIFERFFLRSDNTANSGVLVEFLTRIGIVVLIGLQFYPVLVSVHLNNVIIRFLICLYMIGIVIYTILRDGSCMGFIPLTGRYSFIEEAKLRIDLGTYFILYGIFKNTPHYIFLSYVTGELCVRFLYDSLYMILKNGESCSLDTSDEVSAFSILYVKKLLQRNRPSTRICTKENKVNEWCFKKLINLIHICDDDFYFTTMVLCTYTVAIVFLYYLGWTFVFIYISRPTGHMKFIKSYIESSANIELPAIPFKIEVIISGILTVIIYAVQLVLGIRQYKIDKIELQRKTGHRIPLIEYFDSHSIASNSLHYSGFLIGYTAWGFVICSHLILLILILGRIIYLQSRHITAILSIILPMLVFYLLKTTSMNKIGDSLIIDKERKFDKRSLRSQKKYSIFIYFMFFSDCFLGIASCIIRLMKVTVINLLHMPRLDYTVLGKPLDKSDDAYAAYICYLYMDLNCTSPLKRVFCSICWDAIKKKPRTTFDGKCCTIADDDKCQDSNEENESRQNITHDALQLQTKRISKTSLRRLPENESLHAINTTEDEMITFINETMPTPIPQNSTLGTNNDNQTTDDQKTDEDEYGDGGISMKKIRKQKQKEEEKKSKKDETKKKKQQTKPEKSADNDDEDEDGGMSKPKLKNQEPKPKKKSVFTKCFIEQTTDENISKQKESPKKKSNTSKKHINDESEDEDGGRIVKTYDTIKMMFSSTRPILDNSKVKDEPSNDNTEHQEDTNSKTSVSMDDQSTTETNSSTTNIRKAYENKVYLLRTTSYCQAQQRSPPVITQRLLSASSKHSLIDENDSNNQYAEISDKAMRLNSNKPLDYITKFIRSLSNSSSKQKTTTTNKIRKQNPRKTARNRWFLAYTLMHNEHLSQERKKFLEEKRRIAEDSQQVFKPVTNNMKPETLRNRRMRSNTTTSIDVQSVPELRLLPLPNTTN